MEGLGRSWFWTGGSGKEGCKRAGLGFRGFRKGVEKQNFVFFLIILEMSCYLVSESIKQRRTTSKFDHEVELYHSLKRLNLFVNIDDIYIQSSICVKTQVSESPLLKSIPLNLRNRSNHNNRNHAN